MNILVNPTGKRGRFRGVDWWVEHNNLYIKVSASQEYLKPGPNSSPPAHIWRKILQPYKVQHFKGIISYWCVQEHPNPS